MAHHHHHHHPPPETVQTAASYAELNLKPGAKWVKSLTQGRLDQFVGGHYSSVNLSSALFTHRLDDEKHVKLQVWSAPGLTKPSFDEAVKQKFKPAKKGDRFGPSWSNHWWKVTVHIPSDWTKYERVQFEFDPGCEAMIFSTEGTPLQGITGGYGGDRRVEYIIPLSDRKKGTHEFVIESSCNGMFGVPWNGDTIEPPDMNRYYTLDSADLVVPNQEAWHLLWDFQTLKELTQSLPGNSIIQNKALKVANEILNIFDSGDLKSVGKARKAAEQVFGEGWAEKGAKVYDEGEKTAQVWGIGHCHIDTAWLWPYSSTQQKVARSWSTQVDLMERYPEHRFTCSSAQQFKWLEQLYPKLFEKVKEKIISGQFQPVGGAWVEHDGNMPSGEAFARQMIFGQRYFESRFGKRCETAWLPDSFGLNGALPQIIRSAGMKHFFTQKLSCNVFPHSTFNWVGIDGTQILCHMTPVDTYTAQATVGDIQKGIHNHKNLESSQTSLLVFGNGDGGGGPLSKMLENLRRIRAATNESRELPVVNMGYSVDDFFDHLDESSKAGKVLPNWHGELYLEFHRGTYTSHGSIKKGNRKSEILLRDVEHVATLASLFGKEGYIYPKSKIDDAWEKVLLNQSMNSVLPGSAIGMVYDDAEKLYAEVSKAGHQILEEAFQALFPSSISLPFSPSSSSLPESSDKGSIIGYNTLPFARRAVIGLPLGTGVKGNGMRGEAVQISKDGNVGYYLMDSSASEGAGVVAPRGLFADIKPASAWTEGDKFVLGNSNVQLTIEEGRITSLIDVVLGRELIPDGESGGLIWYNDRPNYWDAWDIEIHHLETPHPIAFSNISIAENGPVRASLIAEASYGGTTISITVPTLKENSRSFFTFDAKVDWHQRHECLKFEIPLNIHNDNATYEVPWGHVSRPTHKNTALDMAKFEVCGHKYADLSEYGYGVALLSESKYGFACHGNVLSMSLLRGATAPDAEQDQGKHEFAWAVMPHVGSFLESDVPIAAHFFNSPLHVRFIPATTTPNTQSMNAKNVPFKVEGAPNVILETIKRGDDDFDTYSLQEKGGEKSVVLRLYEAYGGHASARLRVSGRVGVKKVFVTGLLEDEEGEGVRLLASSAGGSSIGQGSGAGAEGRREGRTRGTDGDSVDYDGSGSGDAVYEIPFRGFQVVTVKLIVDTSSTSSGTTESSDR
ncbi:hypothetical protein SISNIDRAFT_452270 [Sistotremastrum niveocremeum HHB9708]|uniref:Alpha-mannosidase n=1 Tax=Sistotremastrum niveocremeum HHB9708 TaxID=1314777 RepID=A0A164X4C8_9AGAM|nr:hypothetical protein SISNIDRAFT_452270 [Sistotremastrum niveocremeum HHB9708]